MRTLKNEMNEKQTVQGGLSLKKMWTVLKIRSVSFLRRLWRLFVKEAKAEVADHLSDHLSKNEAWQAAEELMRLYRAWLGYLLDRLGEDEVRAPVDDVSRALDELSCTTVREEEEYIIRIQRRGREVTAHGADDTDEPRNGA